jgi:hypothetical protein
MKRPIFTLLVVACTSIGVARAQSASTPTVAQPASPAPVVVTTSAPEASAPAVVQAPANTAPTSVTQIVYTPQLPSAADITNAASAQGLTVERIVQTSNQVIAFYRNASGQTSNVAYQSLPPAGTTTTPATAPNVVVTSPPPTVVYQPAPPRVVYYESPSYYYPRVWYPPVSFSFGLGYRGHYHGGGYYHRGHYHRR